jgi:hypothetical protein
MMLRSPERRLIRRGGAPMRLDMKLHRAAWLPRPRESSETHWMNDPVVVATAQEYREARRDWLKVAPTVREMLRDHAPHEAAALERMMTAHTAYCAAKDAAFAAAAGV